MESSIFGLFLPTLFIVATGVSARDYQSVCVCVFFYQLPNRGKGLMSTKQTSFSIVEIYLVIPSLSPNAAVYEAPLSKGVSPLIVASELVETVTLLRGREEERARVVCSGLTAF